MKIVKPCAFIFFLIITLSFICTESKLEKVMQNPYLVLRSLLMSYPDKISSVDYDYEHNEWFITIGSARLYWAEGRLLPKEEVANAQKWRPIVDYLYPKTTPDPKDFSNELVEQIRQKSDAQTRKTAPLYHIAFFDALYNGGTRRLVESHIKRFDYLGTRVSVHTSIIPALLRVETKLKEQALFDSEVAKFIESISSIEGYNWRDIADSSERSNHSWGIAIDILPKNWKNKNVYWNWVSWFNSDWMLIPLDRRWLPPESVIKIFESEGFIWGGKWYLWDTMHFEYRPELLLLQQWGY